MLACCVHVFCRCVLHLRVGVDFAFEFLRSTLTMLSVGSWTERWSISQGIREVPWINVGFSPGCGQRRGVKVKGRRDFCAEQLEHITHTVLKKIHETLISSIQGITETAGLHANFVLFSKCPLPSLPLLHPLPPPTPPLSLLLSLFVQYFVWSTR